MVHETQDGNVSLLHHSSGGNKDNLFIFFQGFGSTRERALRFAERLVETQNAKPEKNTFKAKKGYNIAIPWTSDWSGFKNKKSLDEMTERQYALLLPQLLQAKKIRIEAHSFGNIKKDAFLVCVARDKKNGPTIFAKIEKVKNIAPLYAFSRQFIGIIINFFHSLGRLFTGNFGEKATSKKYLNELKTATNNNAELKKELSQIKVRTLYCKEDKIINHVDDAFKTAESLLAECGVEKKNQKIKVIPHERTRLNGHSLPFSTSAIYHSSNQYQPKSKMLQAGANKYQLER